MNLYEYDQAARSEGYAALCGMDEAGRGPLAGPVYAAAVILPADFDEPKLRDSKKLTPKRREALFEQITGQAVAYAIAAATNEEIDAHNILQATMLAMRRAVEQLDTVPDLVLIDGNADPGLGVDTRLVVKGDDTSACIAAASVLAKVARDRHMELLDSLYPQYRFAKHKGYGTALHYKMLDEHGPSPVHRATFLRKWQATRDGSV